HEIFGGGLIKMAGGLADAALVVAKNGDAFAREIVGKHEKGAMAGDGFVAVLRTRSGDENSGGKWTRPGRECQGSRERNLRFRIRKGHLFFAVGIRSYGILPAHQLEQLIRALELQVASDPALRPNPGDHGFCRVYRALVDAIHEGNLKMRSEERRVGKECRTWWSSDY